MAKQQTCQKFVFKIHTKRLVEAKWDLTLPLDEARRNHEIISLADSTVLRWIDELNGVTDAEAKARSIKRRIKMLRNEPSCLENRREIRRLYTELDTVQFKPDYMCLVVDKKNDYRRACSPKGFKINGITYRRLVGTTGGVKNSTIVFVSDRLIDEIRKRIDNGRNKGMEFIPAKLEAYRALACSASIPVTDPDGVLVVDDCFTHFKDHVIVLDDGVSGEPTMVENPEQDCELCASDGFGLVSYDLAQQWSEDLKLPSTASGFCVRNAFCKGMLFPFPFREFAKKVAKQNMVRDIWGNYKDVNRVQVILTGSMLKLWDSYHSCEDYFENCQENHYHFSVTKTCELDLDEERNLNYQFIQSYQLTNDEIRELVKPTLDEIKGVMGGDWRDALLYLRGSGMRDDPDYINSLENDYIKALTGGTNQFGRVKFSTIWNYIKGKADSTYQPKGSYAASSHTHDDRYYTEAEVDGKLSGKAASSHNHDDRYYTETEVDTKLGTKAGSGHTHGLNSSSLAKTVDNATTNSWDMVGGNKDFLLRSLRMQAKAPDWLEGNYAAGIAFGGSDTKGVISHAYSSPAIKFAGGNGAAPVWWLRLTGTSGKSYDLNAMPPASHTHTKSQVGLGNVDNTADASKSVKYATTAGTAANAATSKSLQLLSSTRPTSMNFNLAGADYLGKVTYQIASSSTTTGKPPRDSGVLNFSWDNSGYGAQVAVENNSSPLIYVRGATNNNGASKWDATWKTVEYKENLGAAAYKSVKNLSGVNHTGWKNNTTDDTIIPSMSFMAYWNGAYSQSGNSNLQYCDRGRFGTIVTKNSGDYASAGHTHSFASITGKPSTYPPSSHTHNYAGSTSAGGAANSANALNPTFTFNCEGTNVTGYRLIGQVSLGQWSNYRCIMLVRSRHTGAGIVTVTIGNNTGTITQANAYAEIKYCGPSGSGTIISGDSYQVWASADGKTGYLFWKHIDYSPVTIHVISSDFALKNGTWMTGIGTGYGKCIATTQINAANTALTASVANSVAWGNVSGKPSTYAPSAHTHDDRYYTETEVNNKLANYQPKGSYAASGHTHDDRYYTESEVNSKLSVKAESIVLKGNENLNSITSPGLYSCGGGNSLVNKPNNIDSIGLIVIHNAAGSFYTQILTTDSNSNTYRRTCSNGTWSSWTQDKYTDTNTWRGIQNNLTSDSKTDSLSAAQGKALKTLVDGKAASGHTHTKAQIGLGNVDNTADKNKSVASAAKLTTARTVSGGSDIVLSFNYDGSANSNASIGFYSCYHTVGNTNNYPFHRFAKLDANKNAWVDHSMTFLISQDYINGGYGICRLVYRSNADSGNASVVAQWLVRKGLSADTVQVAIKTDKTNGAYCDAFYKSTGTYMGVTIRAIASGGRASSSRTWTLVSSNEANGTTATDKKASYECWKTIAEAGTALHKQAYSSSASATDEGYVATAGSASSAGVATIAAKLARNGTTSLPMTFNWSGKTGQPTWLWGGEDGTNMYVYNPSNFNVNYAKSAESVAWGNVSGKPSTFTPSSHTHNYAGSGSAGGSANSAVKLDSSAGSTTQPVYFSGGKPVVIGYTIAKSVPADAKFTDTNTWRGIQNNLTSTATDQSLSAAQGKILNETKAPSSGSNNYVRVYNSANVGGSSSVTLNDLAKQHCAVAMIDSATDNPLGKAGWVHALSMAWSNNSNASWVSQIALGVQNSNGMWYRTNKGATVGAGWKRVYDSSYHPTADNGVSTSGTNYIRFGNGTQICWGDNSTGVAGGTTITFPVPFNVTPPYIGFGSIVATQFMPYLTARSSTSFTWYKEGTTWGKVCWVAIGTWK